ncbi:methylcrotonoyl-CoA carboxylase subunit alpha, mitochondrial [Platysternon megacephalum]|uniref:Methylcrotonoyl-CoA carboxylase subunit alpha, mitochondrial n=1 Tax=Platysternon megacephalum TaxID=55544 RepID=A0A4D9DWC5_9SAUR|nr:methylcrotonoyl-CoA carboxylase subunit alpha, mitochondrial [Platysternon megacephalum]
MFLEMSMLAEAFLSLWLVGSSGAVCVLWIGQGVYRFYTSMYYCKGGYLSLMLYMFFPMDVSVPCAIFINKRIKMKLRSGAARYEEGLHEAPKKGGWLLAEQGQPAAPVTGLYLAHILLILRAKVCRLQPEEGWSLKASRIRMV